MTSARLSLTYNLNLNDKMNNEQKRRKPNNNRKICSTIRTRLKDARLTSLLEECATLMANCDYDYNSRQQAKYKEQELLGEIAKIDLHFAIQCGYLIPDN
jgi:hypothetical protein